MLSLHVSLPRGARRYLTAYSNTPLKPMTVSIRYHHWIAKLPNKLRLPSVKYSCKNSLPSQLFTIKPHWENPSQESSIDHRSDQEQEEVQKQVRTRTPLLQQMIHLEASSHIIDAILQNHRHKLKPHSENNNSSSSSKTRARRGSEFQSYSSPSMPLAKQTHKKPVAQPIIIVKPNSGKIKET